jgi:hypothetical protein
MRQPKLKPSYYPAIAKRRNLNCQTQLGRKPTPEPEMLPEKMRHNKIKNRNNKVAPTPQQTDSNMPPQAENWQPPPQLLPTQDRPGGRSVFTNGLIQRPVNFLPQFRHK